jgi:hypothetical protein
MSRQELDLSKLGQFSAKPDGSDLPARGRKRPDKGQQAGAKHARPVNPVEAGVGFPSREPVDEAQLNIKLSHADAARFRRLAKADRYTLGAFLTLLMDGYEGPE